MNVKTRKTVFRFHWAWNYEKEEQWLAKMARAGWHLTSPRGFLFIFKKGEPADVAYRLDFQNPKKFDRKEYWSLFKDAGWEYVGEFGNWHYFRTKAGGDSAHEIHTDPESKIAMFRRLLRFLAIISVVVWAPIVTNIGDHRPHHDLWYTIRGIQVGAAILMVYAIIRIAIKIGRIKKNRQP